MMTYSQTTGLFTGPDIEGHGYSGHGEGLNNAAMQDVHDVGPIPQNENIIHPPQTHPRLGKIVMWLEPVDKTKMFNRVDLYIHGPHENDKRDSSHGCIVLPHDIRVKIGEAVLAGNNQLTVTA